MDFLTHNILTIVTFAPAAGAMLLLLFNRENARSIRAFALIVTIVNFVLSLHLVAHFDLSNPDFQFGINVPWVPAYGINYAMGERSLALRIGPRLLPATYCASSSCLIRFSMSAFDTALPSICTFPQFLSTTILTSSLSHSASRPSLGSILYMRAIFFLHRLMWMDPTPDVKDVN